MIRQKPENRADLYSRGNHFVQRTRYIADADVIVKLCEPRRVSGRGLSCVPKLPAGLAVFSEMYFSLDRNLVGELIRTELKNGSIFLPD